MSEKERSKQAGILVLGNIAAALGEAVVLFVIVRLIGQAEVGVLTGMLMIYGIVTPIMASGFPAALMYFLPTRPLEERRAIAVRFARTLAATGVVAGLIIATIGAIDLLDPNLFSGFTRDPDTGELQSIRYLLLMGLWPIADLPARMLSHLLIVEQRAGAAAGVKIIKSIGQSVATLVPIALGANLWFVVGSLVGFGLVYGLLVPYYLRVLYAGAERVECPVSVREMFRFAIPLGLTEAAGILNRELDKFLIMLTFVAAAFAEYRVGAWQIPFVVTIPYAVGAVYTPRFRELFKEGRPREAIRVWRLSIQKVSLLVIPVTAVFLVGAEETIELLATDTYANAAGVFRLYCIFTLGRVAAFGNVIVAAGKTGFVMRAAMFSLITNILISVPLVLGVGFEGPALGTVLSFAMVVFFYCWMIAQASQVPLREIFPFVDYMKVVVVTAVACSGAVVLKLSLDAHPGLMLALEAAIVLVSFAILGTLTRIIEREDWAFVWDWVRLRALKKDSDADDASA